MDNIIENVQENVRVDVKKEGFSLEVYQIVVMIAVALLFAVVPSLLVWKFHIMSVTDPAVLFGLVCCYAFAAILIIFNVFQIRKLLLEH